MLQTKLNKILAVLILSAMLLAACAPVATPTAAPAPTQAAPTLASPTEAPKPAPTETKVPQPQDMVLATTTSTQDSGLLDYLLPDFEKEANVKIKVIAVGSGQALQMGKDGDADVLLVHSPAAEKEFMEAGDGVRREAVMYNDFIIVGPEDDPAKIGGMKSVVEAFKTLAVTKSKFVSRGDDSGTHVKEKGIWTKAEIEPASDWYVSAGQGMGAVLMMAEEMQAYTLSDRATFLARVQEGLKLKIMVEGDSLLLNPYGVIAVNPAKNPNIKNDLANQFIDWIISIPTQEKIQAFKKEELGQSLFYPNSTLWLEANKPAGGLMITGKVAEEKTWSEDDVKSLETMDVQAADKDGKMIDYKGVSLKGLLGMAKPDAGAATLVFVAGDGYSAEIPLADALACEECIVAFNDDGGFRMILPGMPMKLQVRGVVELQVK
ncbi:MAG: substrate-binding domain-containing protein [Anaerolineaceae bacterium]|nr:substrate-binding domain-containing protein [Anaerolineaceae bacterium]